MVKVNALGDACPIPVVKTKNAIKELKGPGQVETLVDNEIAVQNLKKMADQKGYGFESEQIASDEYRVVMRIGEAGTTDGAVSAGQAKLSVRPQSAVPAGQAKPSEQPQAAGQSTGEKQAFGHTGRNTVVVISSNKMGEGSDELGEVLMKGFIFALSQQDQLPATMLFYNGGAKLTTEGSAALEDLKAMSGLGVEILTCGTCLNHYGLTEKLAVGEVTNMYVIAEKMMEASLIVKP